METYLVNESQNIFERVEIIKAEIICYRKSIKRLIAYAEGRRKIDLAPYAPRIVKYSCIPRSAKRVCWTLQNLKTQILILEAELQALTRYGTKEAAA